MIPLSHTAPLARKRTVGWQDSDELARIWQLLGRIQSSNKSLLDIQYSQDGITLAPVNCWYYGPFSGYIYSDTEIAIGNDRAETDYVFRDTITLGVNQIHKSARETITAIDADQYIYYSLTETTSSDFAATLGASATYPVQDTTTPAFFVILGKTIWDEDNERIKNWAQYWQAGDIHFAMPTISYDSSDGRLYYQYQTEHERLITTAETCS